MSHYRTYYSVIYRVVAKREWYWDDKQFDTRREAEDWRRHVKPNLGYHTRIRQTRVVQNEEYVNTEPPASLVPE